MVAALTSFHFWLFFCLAVISLASAQDPIGFIYNGFNGSNLHLDGNARIHKNGLLQLTNTSKQFKGHAFYPSPIKFNTSSLHSLSFSTNFVIAMVPEYLKGPSGHGIAFVMSPSMDFSYAVESQYLGLFNTSNNGNSSNHIFAVEFDTILSPEFKDIDNNHVGIDVNGLRSFESATATYFSNEQGKNISLKLICGRPIQVWIDYSDAEKLLNVTLAPVRSQKPHHPLLSTQIDLSGVLDDTMYVGFSASTGSIASNHYILGWSFKRGGQAQSLVISELPKLPKVGRRIKSDHLIMIVAAALLLLVIIGAAYVYRRKKYEEVMEDWEKQYGTHRFTYRTIYKATDGFKEEHVIGQGGFGMVYKGTLAATNEPIAVKKVSHESDQAMQGFISEIGVGRLMHKNLVRLRGYCRRKKELLLVYDYMPNGSLDKFLFEDDHPNLDWPQRYHIIKGIAAALLYLHEECDSVVLHRDIKASNILLDSKLNGRLGDFGLAKLYDHDAGTETTRVAGTVGYVDPEIMRTGKIDKTADLYAFGAFLLEVACGRKPFDPRLPPEDILLLEVVRRCLQKSAILDACDPRLRSNYAVEENKEMEKVLKLGLLCSSGRPNERPTIREVVQYLDGNATLPDRPLDTSPENLPSPSCVLEIDRLLPLPAGNSSTETSTSAANNTLASNFVTSFASLVGKVSFNSWSWSSLNSVLHIGR